MFFWLRFRVKPGMTVGFGVVPITHPACANGTSYPSLRIEREEESVIIICLKDKNVNNPGYRPGNNVTHKLNPEVG
jgi:hypothetical protein